MDFISTLYFLYSCIYRKDNTYVDIFANYALDREEVLEW